MQIRNVLRVYSLLRNFTDDETALLETLRSLTDSDREQMVETLAPAKPAVRKRKPRATQSLRAASLATAIGSRGSNTGVTLMRCAYGEGEDNGPDCDEPLDNLIHDEKAGYAGYHEFQVPKVVAAGG